MRIQKGHAHAYTEYDLVGWRHYVKLLISVIDCKLNGWKSLTVHLPFEVQHIYSCGPFKKGIGFIRFGEKLKKIFQVKLYWENAPWLNIGAWDLKYENMTWSSIRKLFPTHEQITISNNLDLTLDTGHLILGLKDKREARARIREVLKYWDTQIKHLHLHENDLIHDQHDTRKKSILTKPLVKQLTKGRTFIWERSG